jgi:DNA-directed RNA polymerase specialized sigma24 family protein
MIRVEGIEVSFLDLQGCLKNLSKRKKEAIFWNVILDKKQKDVAKIMGITTVSVGQYVQAGFEQLVGDLGLPQFCEVKDDKSEE